ncbi:L-seryl-tRNA(Sec) selenium transferase [Gordonia namibiensis NBRC 108229]|uniref:L-seryl-tRNA(Sec) selenium transferase n=1 Tax=Gordonia namibiensis NBRC 108229 TaxID=1208314 RepID=K6XRJ8_9ACTN|nr:L-seryl-tRNA(Sec) selenium transferase [Gordonia namibiensis]GAC01450.1 L-seryl-tRNA(Sec) selenium transferase [Gordonia namibiensis NBRC 108229]
MSDPRRRIPRTDALLALPPVTEARERLGDTAVREIIRNAQESARRGEISPDDVGRHVADAVRVHRVSSSRPVLNATGVVVHTNLGRAPLSAAALDAVVAASGYVDVELDLHTGQRSKRGAATRAALLRACPAADDALMVNNGAAALVLATTALAAGRAVVISRGEMIEIGAGFRLTELIASTGARLHEVGTTNRTHLRDYADAVAGDDVGAILKVHPSNFRVEGFTRETSLGELRDLGRAHGVPVIADIGSGLLQPDPLLPDEPDATSALSAGADLVIASGDKLLGGPQAGLLLGDAELIQRLAGHPLARAVRADKLALAAMEATVSGPRPPVHEYLHADTDRLRVRTENLGAATGFQIVEHDGRVGGGGAPGVPLHGWAVRLPVSAAQSLRLGDPAVLPRVHDDACLIDLRCIPEADDPLVLAAIKQAAFGA